MTVNIFTDSFKRNNKMNRKKALVFFILLTSLSSSVLLVPVYGLTNDNEPVAFFNLTYKPTPIKSDDEVTVMCTVLGVFIIGFTDDFERAEIGLNWTGMIGNWTIENGYLRQSEVNSSRKIFAGNSTWSDYILKLKVKKIGTVENTIDIFFRKGKNDTLSDLYTFSLRGDTPEICIFKGSGDPFQYSEWPSLGKVQYQPSADIWYNVKIQVYNDTIKTQIWPEDANEPGDWVFELSDSDYEAGKIGLSCSNQAAFDDIEVYLPSMMSISELNLWYSVNNGTSNKLVMENTDNENYQAIIPTQTEGTTVSMYVEAVDNLENRFNSETISYVVQVPPPLEIPWSQIILITSAIVIIVVVWFAFRKGYLAIEIIE